MSTAAGAAVIAHDLVHIFHVEGHDVAALSGISLTIDPGEFVGLLGPSGSGKSTLLMVCAALLSPSAGRLLIDNTNIVTLPDQERDRLRALSIGVVLQGSRRNLLDYLTVGENIEFAQRAARAAGGSADQLPEVAEILDLVGLPIAPTAWTGSLAPDQLQLLALACGLAHRPRLLLADEPTSQLDDAARDLVLAALTSLNARWRTTVVLVTHDAEVAAALPRTVTIRDGRIGAEGRRGEQYGVITADGSLALPAHLLAVHPPGTLLRIEPSGRGLRLDPVEPDAAPGRDDRPAADPTESERP